MSRLFDSAVIASLGAGGIGIAVAFTGFYVRRGGRLDYRLGAAVLSGAAIGLGLLIFLAGLGLMVWRLV